MTKPETPENPGDESEDVRKTSSHVASVRSGELLQGGRELRIVHDSEVYRLLVTRNNKLILQK